MLTDIIIALLGALLWYGTLRLDDRRPPAPAEDVLDAMAEQRDGGDWVLWAREMGEQ